MNYNYNNVEKKRWLIDIKTVILDRCTIISNGDIDFEPITRLGDCACFDLLEKQQIIEAARDAEAIICNKAIIDREIMERCKRLRYVGLFATGYNNVDLSAADGLGISVANVPGYSTDSVAQHTFALILALATSLPAYNDSVKSGVWCKSAAFTYLTEPMTEIRGKTLGILGFGNIGRAVAKIADAFGMRVLVSTRAAVCDCDYELVGVDELFERSDFLTLHCPLTDQTRYMINGDAIGKMKPGVILINTGRGQLIHTEALIEGLKEKKIGAAGLDVYEEEAAYFYEDTSDRIMDDDILARLLSFNNVIMTSHQGFFTREALDSIAHTTLQNINDFDKHRKLVNEVRAEPEKAIG